MRESVGVMGVTRHYERTSPVLEVTWVQPTHLDQITGYRGGLALMQMANTPQPPTMEYTGKRQTGAGFSGVAYMVSCA